MNRHLKIAINVLASLVVMVTGSMQVAQADEVGLDFSVPQTDVTVAYKAAATTQKAAPTSSSQPTLNRQAQQTTLIEPSVVAGASLSAPSLMAMANSADAIAQKRAEKASEDAAKQIAIDFSVPTGDSTPVAAEFSTQPASKLEPTPKPPKPPKASLLPPSTSTAKLSTNTTKSKQVTALRRAIVGQESAGKFWIINPHSGALGYGQVMPENIAPWSRAALGREVSIPEFLNNPDIQLKVIDHKLDQYLIHALQTTGGDEATAVKRVAATWYSGNPNLYTSTTPQFYNGHSYPSIAAYSQSVLQRYQQQLHG